MFLCLSRLSSRSRCRPRLRHVATVPPRPRRRRPHRRRPVSVEPAATASAAHTCALVPPGTPPLRVDMASDLKDVTNKMAAVNVGDGKAGEKSTAASVRAPPNKIRRPRRRAVCSARPLRLPLSPSALAPRRRQPRSPRTRRNTRRRPSLAGLPDAEEAVVAQRL